ncbi:MAG: hypothetical protein IPJ66_18180 [Bacteroidetes bacterium]|nr:hypothetical protein [Bacteroidota bacterium]
MLFLHGGRDYQVTDQDFNGWKSGLMQKAMLSLSYILPQSFFITGEGKSTPKEYMQKRKCRFRGDRRYGSWIHWSA